MRGATNQLHTCRPGTARAMPVRWVMSNAAFWSLWCFVFVLPWDKFILMPVLGSIPRLVGLAASAVGVVHVLARRRRSEEHTSELQSRRDLVCRLLLEKKKIQDKRGHLRKER